MTLRPWPSRSALAAGLLVAVGLAALELLLQGHANSMGWALPALPVRVPALVVVFALRDRLPVLALVVAVADSVAQPQISAALPVAAYALARHDPRRTVQVSALAVTTVALMRPWTLPSIEDLGNALAVAGSFVLLPAALGAYRGARARLVQALRERAERAEAAQTLATAKAVLEERARIAREMHDVVGHKVSLMVLHAGAIEMAGDDPATVRTLAGHVQTAGRQALGELAQLVGVLRQAGGEAADDDAVAPLTPAPTINSLDELLDESRRTGMDVALDVSGRRRPVPDAVERTAYRVVQEALTNAAKHAAAAPVQVGLNYGPETVTITVTNAAGHDQPAGAGGGHGLLGLRERALALGGSLYAGRAEGGGFRLECTLPTGDDARRTRRPARPADLASPAATA